MSKLSSLIKYYRNNRQAGHTYFSLTGLAFDRPAVVLCASSQHAKIMFNMARDLAPNYPINHAAMQVGEIRFRSINWLMGEHLAYNLPVMVEHFALDVLYHEDQEETLKRGFYAGQAVAGVKLEACHRNYKRWSTSEWKKQEIKNE